MKILLLLIQLMFFSQEKQDIYICYDRDNNKNNVFEDQNQKVFYLYPHIDADHFIHKKNTHDAKVVEYKSIKSKLISKAGANKKVKDYLDLKAKKFEKDTGLKANIIRNSPYYPSSYFKKIYIYEKTNDSTGILYEVEWLYAIE